MQNNINKIAKSLKASIKTEKGTKAYDTAATVTRIEGKTAWVHIPGGVDETPVKLTMNAKKGETVQVRVSGGKAWLTGNASAPPTDDTTADKAQTTATEAKYAADNATLEAVRAKDAADRAETSAQEAQTSAANALTSANQAKASATEANNQAISATNSANNALGQLGVVESVVDTLTWIAEHSVFEPTTDTSVVASKTYYVPNNQTLTMTDGTYQVSGLTIFIKDGIVTVNGTATADVYFELGTPSVTAGENIYISGASGGSSQTYGLRYYQAGGSVFVFDGIKKTTAVSGAKYYVYVENGYTATDLIFYPRVSNANDGYEYVIVDSPTGNPTTQGYFELDTDDAVKTYVQTHLALMNDGLYVVKDNSGYKVKIDNQGMYVQNPSGAEVAEFGETLRIGTKENEHITITKNAIQAINANKVNVIDIQTSETQLRGYITTSLDYIYELADLAYNTEVEKQINELVSVETNTSFVLGFIVGDNSYWHEFTKNSTVYTQQIGWGYDNPSMLSVEYDGQNNISFSLVSGTKADIKVVYLTAVQTVYAPAWTFGYREPAFDLGGFSFAEGGRASAIGNYSHAEGYDTQAHGSCSHTEGYGSRSVGQYSHAQNRVTYASGYAQTVIGQYNATQGSPNTFVSTDLAFIIGNGTSNNARSNALTVDWSGNVNIASGAKYKINGTNLSASDVSAVALSDKYTRSSVGTLDWTNQTDGDAKVIAKSALAFWNGAYSGTSSNLAYCNKGAFGTLATKNSLSASDVGAVPTSRTVNSKALSSNITLSASDVGAFPKSNMTRGISMVSTIPSDGKLTLNNTDIGGSSSAKIQGVLAIPQYSNGVTIKHNYDASSTSQVVLNFYKADGSAYSGAMRYFLITFPNTWTP